MAIVGGDGSVPSMGSWEAGVSATKEVLDGILEEDEEAEADVELLGKGVL